ncbi:MAG: aspartate--tRNA ligase [Symbiobacteriaceae bacterium]|nr:aspartate--tRNA ligase [Symbiobacteriaceae bacterium]
MTEPIQGMKRSHFCDEISESLVGQVVTVNGWVQRRRDHGALIFIDVRDRSGLVQAVFDAEDAGEVFKKAEQVRGEFVVAVRGKLVHRAPEAVNPNMVTGRYEIRAQELRILNSAKTPPFYIQDDVDVDELVRLKYRYLDLRRPEMQRNLILRSKVTTVTRSPRRKAPATTWCRRASIRASSTPCPSRRSSSSSFPWWPAWSATFRSSAASAMRTCGPTGSLSSPRSTWRCPLSSGMMFSA